MNGEVYVGIDIGSSSAVCVIADVDEDGVLHVTGAGQAPTEGSVFEGVTVDLHGAEEAVLEAVEEAESISSWKVTDAAVSLSGQHVRGFPGRGTVNIDREDAFVTGKVTEADIDDATETAQLIKLPRDSMVLRTEQSGYTIDGSALLTRPPIGLRAERLTADIYMITADRTAVMNLQQVMKNTGINVASIYPAASASARSVLTSDEMDMGVVLVDIGAETTDVAVYYSGALAHLAVLPVGGSSITRAIQQIRIPGREAQRLKGEIADISRGKSGGGEITVSTFGGRSTVPIDEKKVNEIVYKSVCSILGDILCELRQAGIQESDLPAGMVLCGGTSNLSGIASAASGVLGIPVEVGKPGGMDFSSSLIKSPEFAAAVGLILMMREEENTLSAMTGANPMQQIFQSVRKWIKKLR